MHAYSQPKIQLQTHPKSRDGPPMEANTAATPHPANLTLMERLVEEVEVVQGRGGVREASLHRETEERHHSQTGVLDLRGLQLHGAVGIVRKACTNSVRSVGRREFESG